MRRKVLLSVISAVCIVLCAFALVGCGQKEMDVKGNAFVFKDISFTYSDNFPADEKITAEELAGYKTMFKDKLLTFTEDGKFEMQYYVTLNGTYVQDDAKVTLTVTQDGKTETIDATVSGNDVTVKMWSEFKLDDNSTAKAYINIVYTKTTVSSGSEGGSGEGTPTPASTQVTEAQWKTAMTSVRNYSGSTTTEYQGQPLTISLKCAGDTLLQEHGTQAIIITKDGNNYYWYDTENSGTTWERETIDQDEYEEMSAQLLLFSFFENDYSSFTYADGKYTATANLDKTATMNGIITSMEVGFSNGQIVSTSFTATSEGENYSYSFSDFGTTTITIPTDYTEASSSNPTPATGTQVTEEQWMYALMDLREADYKVTITETKDGSTTTVGVITYFGKTISVVTYVDEEGQSVNEEAIYTWEDGSSEGVIFYKYAKKSDGSYTRQEIQEDEYLENVDISYFEMFAGLYIGFTYDEESEKYVCTSDSLESFGLSGVTASVGFLDGEVISFEMAVTSTEESETITETVTVSEIGTATVTIPTEYTEVDGSDDDAPATGSKVNEAQWKSAMTGTNNYTYNKSYKSKKEEYIYKVDKSEDSFVVLEEDATNKDHVGICTLENGNYYFYYTYYYTYNSPAWIRSSESKYTACHEQVNVLNVLKDAFSQFTYNADTGTYYCQRFQTTYENKLFSYSQVTVTFEDGEIVAFNCYLMYGGKEGDDSYDIVLSDFGTTETIQIPTSFTESSN